MNLLKKLRKTIISHKLLNRGDTVVVGVSGGSDSVCLLNLLCMLKESELRLIVAHVNHLLRGKESDRDARFVENLATELGVQFELLTKDTAKFKKQTGKSLEEAGRIIRYDFFNELVRKYNAQKIATAHTLDDQVETVLMRFLRGSGIKGLSGIPYFRKPNIIRPLLDISKQEIKDFLTSNKIRWMEDSSNLGEDFFRNQVRWKILPALKEINPNLEQTINRTREILTENESYISQVSARTYRRIFRMPDTGLSIGNLNKFKKLHRYMKFTLIREAITRINENLFNIDFEHVHSALELLDSEKVSGEVNLPGDIIIAKSYEDFVITHKAKINPKYSYKVDSFGDYSFDHVSFGIKKVKVNKLDSPKNVAFISPEKFKFPLEVRNFRPGDKFVPFGMKGEKKLKDFFIDEKIPRYLRRLFPLFITGGEIAWIGGLRVSERFRVVGENAIKIELR